jgi:hypothetical protein
MIDITPYEFPQLVPAASLKHYRRYSSKFRLKRILTQMKYQRSIRARLHYLFTGFFIRVVATQLQYIIWTIAQRMFKSTYDSSLSKLFHNVGVSNLVASRQYKSRVYPEDITIFLSKEITQAISDDPHRDWSGVSEGNTNVHLITDTGVPNIGMMFREPYVQALAKNLMARLDEAQTEQT